MRAITVEPGVEGSARLENVDEPVAARGELVVQALALGVCGTDLDVFVAAWAQGRAMDGSAALAYALAVADA